MPWFRRKAQEEEEQAPTQAAAPTDEPATPTEASPGESTEATPGPRRRGSRGGRGRKKPAAGVAPPEAAATDEKPAQGSRRATPRTSAKDEAPKAAGRRTTSKPRAAKEEKPKAPARSRRRTAAPRRSLPAVRKEMLISSDVGEQRVAVLEDARPVEVYLGRPGRRSIAGNVYKGTVDNVLPGMEASFVDIGLGKNGFLYVDEIVVPELEGRRHGRRIQDLIKRGEEVLVQAVKDPMGTKGARLTTEISLPGRFLVYVPFGDGIGVSRRLDDDERDRLKGLCKSFELSEGGIIVRTAAEGASETELAGDLAFLRKLWSTIQGRGARVPSPSLVYQEAELPLRVVRDLFVRDFERLAVDHERTYRRIVSYLKRTSPDLAEKVEWYRDPEPLMQRSGVDAAVRSTLDRRVDLPSGGYLVFDYAEAFTVIDVNTGRFVGARGKSSGARLEDTITKNNLEAASEIVRQLRLRDIGGIIVIDFIDMANPKNRHDVEEALKRELERDRTKTYVVEISPLGLVEMTRQNVTDGPREILTSRCPVCHGDGIVVSEETYAVRAERVLRQHAARSKAEALLVELSSHVAGILIGPAGVRLAEIERETGKRFAFETRDDLPADHVAVLAEGRADEIEPRALPVSSGQELELRLEEVHRHHPDDAIARLDGYVIAVAGGAGQVGKRVRVRIERPTRTVAYAALAVTDRAEAPVEAGTLAEEADAAGDPGPAAKPARRGTRGGRGRKKPDAAASPSVADGDSAAATEVTPTPEGAGGEEEKPKKKTRRGTRGGRGRKKTPTAAATAAAEPDDTAAVEPVAEPLAAGAPRESEPAAEASDEAEPAAADGEPAAEQPKKKTRRGTRGGRGRKRPAASVPGASGNGEVPPETDLALPAPAAESTAPEAEASANGDEAAATAPPRKKTRRGTRGGRGRKKPAAAADPVAADASPPVE